MYVSAKKSPAEEKNAPEEKKGPQKGPHPTSGTPEAACGDVSEACMVLFGDIHPSLESENVNQPVEPVEGVSGEMYSTFGIIQPPLEDGSEALCSACLDEDVLRRKGGYFCMIPNAPLLQTCTNCVQKSD